MVKAYPVMWIAGFLFGLGSAYAQEEIRQEDRSVEKRVVAGSSMDVWQLQYQRTTRESSKVFPKPMEKREKVILRLGRSGYELVETAQTIMYDASRKRLITLMNKEQQFVDVPIHSQVHFRANETAHRRAMCVALEQVKLNAIEMEPCSLFDLETRFSLINPELRSREAEESATITQRQSGDLVSFLHQGQEYVSFQPSEYPLPPHCRNSFRQFLSQLCRIHPSIQKELLTHEKLPKSLTFHYREGAEQICEEYILQEASIVSIPNRFELPAGFQRHYQSPVLKNILEEAANADHPDISAIQKEAEQAIDVARKRGDIAEAVVAAWRYFLVTDDGIGFRSLLQRCGGVQDLQVRRAMDGMGNLESLESLKRSLTARKSQWVYILDYMIADLAMAQHTKDIEVVKLLQDTLQKDRLMIGAYLDLARCYFEDWDYNSAWQCIEAAQRLSPMHSNLDPFKMIAKQLEADFPYFY